MAAQSSVRPLAPDVEAYREWIGASDALGRSAAAYGAGERGQHEAAVEIFALARTAQLASRCRTLVITTVPEYPDLVAGVAPLPLQDTVVREASTLSSQFWVAFDDLRGDQAPTRAHADWRAGRFRFQRSFNGQMLQSHDAFGVEFELSGLPMGGVPSDDWRQFRAPAPDGSQKGRPPLPEAEAGARAAMHLSKLPADNPLRWEPKLCANLLKRIYADLGSPKVGERRLIEGARAILRAVASQESPETLP